MMKRIALALVLALSFLGGCQEEDKSDCGKKQVTESCSETCTCAEGLRCASGTCEEQPNTPN